MIDKLNKRAQYNSITPSISDTVTPYQSAYFEPLAEPQSLRNLASARPSSSNYGRIIIARNTTTTAASPVRCQALAEPSHGASAFFNDYSSPPQTTLRTSWSMASSVEPKLGQIASKILEDALQDIIHKIAQQQHRKHKALLATLDPTTRLPHCDTCKQPKLLDPPLAPKVRGAASDPPSNTTYCDRKPWARRPGHDIYGNPFLKSDVTGRPLTKKEREAQKNNKKEDDTPASENQDAEGIGPPSPSQENENHGPDKSKLEKGEKKASKIDEKLKKGEYVPWHTCPSCKRSLLITRFAKHLEQCMGLSGRQASRNAMAKMNGTPSGSRGGTPGPGQSQEGGGKEGNNEEGQDDLGAKGSGGVRKKLLKKGLKDKVKKEKGANGKVPKSLASAKRPPNATGGKDAPSKSSPAPSFTGDGKRDREEEEEEEVPAKKRQKLTRVGSTASLLSQSSIAPELETQESNDGSFVADGSIAEGDD